MLINLLVLTYVILLQRFLHRSGLEATAYETLVLWTVRVGTRLGFSGGFRFHDLLIHILELYLPDQYCVGSSQLP